MEELKKRDINNIIFPGDYVGEDHQWKHEFVDLEYDVETVIRELEEEKLYEISLGTFSFAVLHRMI